MNKLFLTLALTATHYLFVYFTGNAPEKEQICYAVSNDHKTLGYTHGDYPEAMRTVARREQVPFIELNGMTRTFYEALGEEGSKKALVHYPANTFAGQDKPLADNTHFNPYGAWEVAKMIVMGLKQLNSPLVDHLRTDWQDFNPQHPDDPDQFVWYMSGSSNILKPDGN